MEQNAEKRYRLFALPLTAENIMAAANERFSRATPSPEPGYVLIYSNGDAPEGAKEITDEHVDLLSAQDARWLLGNAATLAAEELEKHKTEALKGMSESVVALEAELERIKNEIIQRGE